jgi:hypothetical protein
MMEPSPPPADTRPATTRFAAWRRRLRWFLAEFLVVVLGILVAMALNSGYQGRHDAEVERDYLQRLSRDLQETIDDATAAIAFENLQLKDAVFAYRSLSGSSRPADTEAVAQALSRLATRRTMMLKNSTYQDLVSTGNLRLVRDARLRDRITRFYQGTGLRFETLNRNNSALVDETYARNVIASGLVETRFGSNLPVVAAADEAIARELGATYRSRPDALWTLPPDAPQWAMLRSNLGIRLRASAIGKQILAQGTLDARGLKAAVDAQLAR